MLVNKKDLTSFSGYFKKIYELVIKLFSFLTDNCLFSCSWVTSIANILRQETVVYDCRILLPRARRFFWSPFIQIKPSGCIDENVAATSQVIWRAHT